MLSSRRSKMGTKRAFLMYRKIKDPVTSIRRSMGFHPDCRECKHFVAKQSGVCIHPKTSYVWAKNARQDPSGPYKSFQPNPHLCGPLGYYFERRT